MAFVSFLLSSSPAAAATYEQTIDFSNVSQECILTRNLTGRARYFHGFHRCHPLEASWEGPFYRQSWVQPQICKPELTSCVYGENSCCWTGCGTLTHVEEHAADFNLGKKFPPGTHRQTLTVTQPVPPALQTVDQIRDATFRLAFTPGSFSAGGACASLSAGFVPGDPLMVPGDVLAITVIIPDRDQSAELNALAGAREGPVGGLVELAFKATKRVSVAGVVQDVPFAGKQVSFSVSGPGNATFSVNPAPTGADGVARTTVTLGGIAGTYSITATCAACRAKPVAQVSVEATALVLEMAAVSAPTQAVAGQPLPEDVKVRVFVSGTETASEDIGVEFRLKDSNGAVLQTAQKTTGPDGIASANFTIGAAGDFTVEAFCAACGVGQTAVFPIEVFPRQDPLALTKDRDLDPTAGDEQSAFVGEALAPIRVKLQRAGADVEESDVALEFKVEPADERGSWILPATAKTNALGRAFAVLTLGVDPGEYHVRVICEECTAGREVIFTAAAKPAPTYFAQLPTKGRVSAASITGPRAVQIGELTSTSAELTVSGFPLRADLIWRVSKGDDLVRLRQLANPRKIKVEPLKESRNVGDVEIVALDPVSGQPITEPHKMTVQRPALIEWTLRSRWNCDSPILKKMPGFRTATDFPWDGEHGELFFYQATVKDHLRGELAVPSNVEFPAWEDGLYSVSPEGPWFPKRSGDLLFTTTFVSGAHYPDKIGYCSAVEYPSRTLFKSSADRCEFVGGTWIQRVKAEYNIDRVKNEEGVASSAITPHEVVGQRCPRDPKQ